MRRKHIPFFVIFLVLILDQTLKFWIKTNMTMNQEFGVFGLEWFRIHFTENEGMAFGMQIGGKYGKLFLTLFRIIAVSFIGYYLYSLVQKGAPKGLIISISLVFAGALGNIIDSIFYGVVFSASSYVHVAEFLPETGGYAPLLHGKVVDMLYFPLSSGYYPEWLPFVGGQRYIFFRPVFNLADTAITSGVFSILVFQRRYFSDSPAAKEEDPAILSVDGSELFERDTENDSIT